jgi:hypothetical protein
MFDSSVIFVNIDTFEDWRSESLQIKKLFETQSLKRALSKNVSKKHSTKKKKLATQDVKVLIGYEDLYTSTRIYEDMTIFLVDKFLEYQKKSNIPKSQKITVITPFNKERAYLQNNLSVIFGLIF